MSAVYQLNTPWAIHLVNIRLEPAIVNIGWRRCSFYCAICSSIVLHIEIWTISSCNIHADNNINNDSDSNGDRDNAELIEMHRVLGQG